MSNGTPTTLDSFEALPVADSSRLIDFERATLSPDDSGDTYDLIVSGQKPYLNMEVRLVPRPTLEGDYLQYQVVGTLPGIGLPALAEYTVETKVTNVGGRVGVEVVGATRSDRVDFEVPAPAVEQLIVRKSQMNLTQVERDRFNAPLQGLHDSGRYMDFVNTHVDAMTTLQGQTWGAHRMGMSDGRNFLSWHREYLWRFEQALREIEPAVFLPYWDWETDRALPDVITVDLAAWGVTRNVGGPLPAQTSITATRNSTSWEAFRSRLEGIHNPVHIFVGGTMGTATSPHDPIFWLHHGFVDKFWAGWQAVNPGVNPPNLAERLQPPAIMDRTVSGVLQTTEMGYVYA